MDDILIAGGYGEVGARIAADLVRDRDGRVVVAGRHPRRGEILCSRLGGRARTRRMNVDEASSVEASLHGVSLVVSCIDQPRRQLLLAAISRGLAYTDITPHLTRWRNAKELDADARRSGARVILAAGLCPGITSVMARAAAEKAGPLRSVETTIRLSVGDRFGPASMRYLLEELLEPFTAVVDGRERVFRPFEESAAVDFGPPIGRRVGYAFPFSDQVFYPRTLGVSSAISRLALDPPWLGRLASRLCRAGLVPHAHSRFGATLRVAVAALKRLYAEPGGNLFAALVEAQGERGSLRVRLSGKIQAAATAAGASAFVRALDDGEIASGVWLPEEVASPASFFARLEASGWVMSWECPSKK